MILWPDEDDKGEIWLTDLTTELGGLGCDLKRVSVDFSLNTKRDAYDFTEDEIVSKLNNLVEVDNPYRAYTAYELMNLKEAEYSWLVDDAIIDTGLFLITAKPKCGKSTLARQLCISVSNGCDFLGRETKKTKTCYMGFEDGVTWTNRRINQHMLNASYNVDPTLNSDNIIFVVDSPTVPVFLIVKTTTTALFTFNPRFTFLTSAE